jgi:hypothetical protein
MTMTFGPDYKNRGYVGAPFAVMRARPGIYQL